MFILPIKKSNNLENASLYFKLKVAFIYNNKNIGNDD